MLSPEERTAVAAALEDDFDAVLAAVERIRDEAVEAAERALVERVEAVLDNAKLFMLIPAMTAGRIRAALAARPDVRGEGEG